jgi:hypothetical protein
MIWVGSTTRCHAPLQHAILLQQHRPKSHFQDATTYREWFEKFVDVVKKVREDNGFAATEPALLIVDAAPQHAVFEELEAAHHIVRVCVPKKQTHIFQPADQLVIANIRKGLVAAASDYLRDAARRNALTPAEMAKEVQRSTAEWRRKQAGFLLQVATGDLHASVVRSWRMTGIPRAIFGTDPGCPVLYDNYATLEDDAVVVSSESDDGDEGDDSVGDGAAEEPMEMAGQRRQRDDEPDGEPGEEPEEEPVEEPDPVDFTLVARLGRPPKETLTAEERKRAFRDQLHEARVRRGMNARFWNRPLEDIDTR